eukprot:CAMPEP_0176443324 /NCGR_PEP_ID=MMETSP0127-20121128/22353_1 /TAXON_ID=938130 /ORGANISM="Platyophrya macrostoma, Strain WH" /LENGTH=546 /DNA_ID=CAMNT_0017828527 /DNA_START=26 /DNA_END=1666 /DNA_ORIENTATION=-
MVEKAEVHSHGAKHTYSSDEIRGFAGVINMLLRNDETCARHIPINPDTEELFEKVGDGLILAKLVYKCNPAVFDLRALNKKENLNVFQIKENLNLAISAAKYIGCQTVSVVPEFIMEKRGHIILGLVWQILKQSILATINLKDHPYLLVLLKEGEKIEDFKHLPPEDILLRWFNYHLEKAAHDRRVKNYSDDLKDGVNYTVLLNQLDKSKCDLTGLALDQLERCNLVVENSKKLEVDTVITGHDLNSGNPKLNLIFCSLIFNACPGLQPPPTDSEASKELEKLFEAAKMLEEQADPSDTREERSFRAWSNSLNLDLSAFNLGQINNLYEDVRDGLILLKLLERISDAGTVEWKKAALKADIPLKKIQNANYAVEIGKKLGFTLVGIGGKDIVDGNKKLILALIWQMVRKHTLDTLGGYTEDELLKWANARVPEDVRIGKFSDKVISNCRFLFALLASIEPRAIDPELVKVPAEGETLSEEDQQLNAKYVISVARKLGATVFCLWEDIKEVKPKMIMTFVAAIAHLEKQTTEKKAMPEFNASEGTTH